MEQVTVVVGQDGSVEVSVQCVKGKRCQDLTKQLEEALGSKSSDRPTAEMSEVAHVQTRR